ncbi:UNVERIFIED_CONTAM: hypothetical protein Sradi_3959600 [Sesamum radiatum]|uniref:Uncharacterized protein n=1 Tax=Sesamum radiatum TaxID=300843 RepID=A0AAW2PFU9_SESRA
MASHQLPLTGDSDPELEQSLSTLESFLGFLGYCQHTFLRATLSWLAFFLCAVALPLFALEFSRCPGCEKFEIETFELEILVARAVVAAVSLLCLSRNLRKYGIRKALFVDRCHGHMTQFRKQYIQKIRVFYCLLASWFGICFLLKAAREVTRLMFRVFLLLEFLIVTATQIMTLLQTTENQSLINFINGGDFAVLSIVQLVGIVLCLSAAAKISHRAQSLGSIASRWHALVTCNSNDASGSGLIDNGGNAEFCPPAGPLSVNYSESDLESSDYMPLPIYAKITSSTSSYHRRQAFVTYVQSNTGGFTIFGWVVDRMLVNTIFFIELSLVFFVLGKTITITVK